ncbi:MAG: hypothetical protein LBE74_00950 [Treponema sp.]|jgi:hypothetical protein|nr:hypothetical protein [Treponema sp.]
MKKILLVGLTALAAGAILLLAGCYDHFAAEDEIIPPPPLNAECRETTYTLKAHSGSPNPGQINQNFFPNEQDYQLLKGHKYIIQLTGYASREIPLLCVGFTDWNDGQGWIINWGQKFSLGTEPTTLTWEVTPTADTSAETHEAMSNSIAFNLQTGNPDNPNEYFDIDQDIIITAAIRVWDATELGDYPPPDPVDITPTE